MKKKRKQYRACMCKRPGYCKRYKREMPHEFWELCQTSEKHRMLFDEIANNFIFGMVQKTNPNQKNVFSGASQQSEENKQYKKRTGSNKVREIGKANEAIQQLKKEGIDLNQLSHVEEKGLGDTVERVLTKFGLTKSLMKKIAGKTCGCNERKKWLNKLLPYGKDNLS
jgi:hypothetical protein